MGGLNVLRPKRLVAASGTDEVKDEGALEIEDSNIQRPDPLGRAPAREPSGPVVECEACLHLAAGAVTFVAVLREHRLDAILEKLT